MIPDPSNPQAWNRFSYVGNRPVNFNDPTGHDSAINEFLVGAASEVISSIGWFIPPLQADLAPQENESTAMLAGRIVGDVISMAGGVWLMGVGGGGITGGAGCAALTAGGCAPVTAGAVVAGGALVLEGAGASVRGAIGLGGNLYLMAKKITDRPSGYRKPTKSAVDSMAPLDEDGNIRCMGCNKVIKSSSMDHFPTWSQRIKNMLFGSRAEVLDEWNNVKKLRPLCLKCNMSHKFENTLTEELPFFRRGR